MRPSFLLIATLCLALLGGCLQASPPQVQISGSYTVQAIAAEHK